MKNRIYHARRVITVLVVVSDQWLSAAPAVERRPNAAIILADDLGIGVDFRQPYAKPLREATVLQSRIGWFAIRKGDWKLIQWVKSREWSYSKTKSDLAGLPRFQLYKVLEDPAEKTNLVSCLLEIIEELKTQLEKYVTECRITLGTRQRNDGPARWPQL